MTGWNQYRLTVVGVLLSASRILAADETLQCAPKRLKLAYSALGRAARLEGKVVLTIDIDAAGKPTAISGTGRPILVDSSKAMLSLSTFPEACANRQATITINYKLRDPQSPYEEDRVAAVAPATYIVTGSILVISDPSPDVRRDPWWKRLWRRIS